jgi:hypothetical protein
MLLSRRCALECAIFARERQKSAWRQRGAAAWAVTPGQTAGTRTGVALASAEVAHSDRQPHLPRAHRPLVDAKHLAARQSAYQSPAKSAALRTAFACTHPSAPRRQDAFSADSRAAHGATSPCCDQLVLRPARVATSPCCDQPVLRPARVARCESLDRGLRSRSSSALRRARQVAARGWSRPGMLDTTRHPAGALVTI